MKIKIKQLFKKNALIFILTILLFLTFRLWRSGNNPGTVSDFSLNLFTEILGVALTVLIVDKLIKRENERQLLPLKLAIYHEVFVFTSRIISFWSSIQSKLLENNLLAEEDRALNIEELFHKRLFDKIVLNLDLESPAAVFPKRPWIQYIPQSTEDILTVGEKILNRYTELIDYQLFKDIHHITEKGMIIKGLEKIEGFYRINKSLGTKTHTLRKYYFVEKEEDFEAIINLYNWCKKERENLYKKSEIIDVHLPDITAHFKYKKRKKGDKD